MRGFPLINAAVILLALCAVLVPLLRLTSSSDASPAVEISNEPHDMSGAIPVAVSVKSAHQPRSLTLSHLGDVIWQAGASQPSEVSLVIPPEGIDLVVHAVWPEGTPESAIEITLEPEAFDGVSQVLWGEGEIEDVLTFIWKEAS